MYFLTLLQIVCHGCGFKVESQSTNEEQFTAFDGKMVTVTICEDCKKDLDAPGKGCFMSLLEKKPKVLFISRCSKIGKKSEGNHMLINDCPHFFLPILLQRKLKSTLANHIYV